MYWCGFRRAHASEDLGFPRRGPGEGLHSAQERGNFAAVFNRIGGVAAVPEGVPVTLRRARFALQMRTTCARICATEGFENVAVSGFNPVRAKDRISVGVLAIYFIS
jgi:hypothetical protein